jgi:hypothetical protein
VAVGEDRERELRRLAANQQGHVAGWQLRARGFTRGFVESRIRGRRLIPVHVDVYAVGYVRRDPLARASAAVLACGQEALLSHESAAALWGMRSWPSMPEVVAPKVRRRPGIRTHRSLTLTREDRDRHHGIAVTSPARTALDIAPRISRKALARAVNDAENASFLRRDAVEEVLGRLPRHPGATALRYVTGLGQLRSGLEFDFVAFAAKHGLPAPLTNVEVAGYPVDVLFPEERVIVELDTWGFHRDRASFESNRERDAATLAAGFVTIRITDERLEEAPAREAHRLHRILCGRRQEQQ